MSAIFEAENLTVKQNLSLVLYVLADCRCPLFILCFCLSAAVAAAHAAALLPYLTGLPWIHQ